MNTHNSTNKTNDPTPQLFAKAQQHLFDGDLFGVNNIQMAVNEYSAAIDEYQKLGKKEVAAGIYRDKIGMLYFNQTDYPNAIKYWKKALTIFRESKLESDQANILNKIGVGFKKLADYSSALAYFQKSLMISRKIADLETEAKTLNNIGNVYKELNDLQRALENFQSSLHIKRNTGDLIGEANTLINIGNTYKGLEKFEKSIQYFELSKEIYKKIRKSLPQPDSKVEIGLAAIAHNIGNVYICQDKYQEALEYYSDGLQLDQAIGNIGQVFADFKDIGDIYTAMKKFGSAYNFYIQASNMANKYKLENYQFLVLESLGKYFEDQDEFDSARTQYSQAIDIIEKIRSSLIVEWHQTGFMKGVLRIYESMIKLLLEFNQYEEAFDYLEKMKARTLLDVLENGNIDYSDVMTDPEVKQEFDLQRQLEKLNHNIASLKSIQKKEFEELCLLREKKRHELNAFEERLYLSHPELKEMRGMGETISFRKAKMLLSRDEAAVYYLVTRKLLIIFLVTRTDLKVHAIQINAKQIGDLVDKLLKQTSRWNTDLAHELYNILIEPIKDQIKNKTRICVIADGKLNSLPFQALQNPDTDKYLIEELAIYYAPSLSALKAVRGIGNYGTSSLLAFGNPSFGGDQSTKNKWRDRLLPLNPLPASELEIDALEVVYDKKVKALTQTEATKSNFKKYASDYGVLHFATHAFTDEDNPMYSSIALSQEGGEHCFLEAREIIRMELNADLVVLSACKTASGKLMKGEGMLGLTRAFFTSGVPTVIASLWNVDDFSTRELMVQFHKRFRNRERPANALREAQLYLINETQYNDPFYWAPFVLIGDSE